jgi:hypothetical protein
MQRPDTDERHTEDLESENELCPHDYPEGRGCRECEYWEYVDFMYDWSRDK